MHDLWALLDHAPDVFKEKAKMALLSVVEEYEDWVACGRPSYDKYKLMQFCREFGREDLDRAPLKFQEFIREYLKKPE